MLEMERAGQQLRDRNQKELRAIREKQKPI
jgi:hypothetical protein